MITGLVALSITSCKKNNLVIDKEVIPPAFAKFNTLQPGDTITTHYIRSNNAPLVLPVGITNVSDQPRVINFSYSSRNAVQGTQYNAPTSITIPAGKALDSLVVTGLFAGYTSTRVDTVTITITGGDGLTASSYKSRYHVILRKYCDVVLANLGGAYVRTFEGTYGPYTSSVTNLTSTGATTATATITNVYDSNISMVVTFDWTNPASFRVNINPQQTQYTSGGLPMFIRANAASASTFSSCDNTITLRLQLYTSAAIVDTWTSSMAK